MERGRKKVEVREEAGRGSRERGMGKGRGKGGGGDKLWLGSLFWH